MRAAFVLDAQEQPEDWISSWARSMRVRDVDHFEFYWFPHTDVALTKTNTRMPGDAPTAPLSPLSRIVDERIVGNGVHQLVCSAGRVAPPLVPAINRLSARVWGDRRFSDVAPRVHHERSVRFREMEYAVPLDELAVAFKRCASWSNSRDGESSFRSRSGWRPPTIGGSRPRSRATADTSRVHRYWRADHRAYFAAVEEIMRARRAAALGKLHTLDAAALRERRASTTSWRCVTASIRRACSATTISTASSAPEGLPRTSQMGNRWECSRGGRRVRSRR
jgi:hypothetical protein